MTTRETKHLALTTYEEGDAYMALAIHVGESEALHFAHLLDELGWEAEAKILHDWIGEED